MWNISNVFFDFNILEKYFHGKTASKNTDKKEINRFFSIIDGELNIMKIYNDYLHYSLPLFIVLWLVFLLNIYNIMSGYDKINNDESDKNVENVTSYSVNKGEELVICLRSKKEWNKGKRKKASAFPSSHH